MIRAATIDDLPYIRDIMNHAILHTTALYDYTPRSAESVRDWYETKQREGMPVIVYEQEQKAAGFGTYGIFRPREAYKFSIEHSVYVAENFQGRGYGKALLQALIELATRQGYHTMIAGIDANNTGSIELHRQFGFAEAGLIREVGYKFDRWLDLLFMQRMLRN